VATGEPVKNFTCNMQFKFDLIMSMILDLQSRIGKMPPMEFSGLDLRFRVVNTRVKFTWHLVSLWREFQRACNTSKRASGSQVGSSFTMTLSRWMQSN